MAKQRINIFEQHAEKMLIALVAAGFLYVVYSFVVHSPNVVELQGDEVTPGQVDAKVKAIAENVYNRLRSADHSVTDTVDYHETQLELAEGPLDRPEMAVARHLPSSVSFGMPVPVVHGPRTSGQITLASVIAPGKPEVASGRLNAFYNPRKLQWGDDLTDREIEFMQLEMPLDRSWITVAARFSLRQQERLFLEQGYQTNLFHVVPVNVLLQRQERSADGQWSVWEDVQPYSDYHLPPVPQLRLVEESGVGVTVPLEDKSRLREFIDIIVNNERLFVRPPLPESELGGEWRPPLLKELAEYYPGEFIYVPPLEEIQKEKKPKRLSAARASQIDLEEANQLISAGKLEAAMAKVRSVLNRKGVPRRYEREAQDLRLRIQEEQRRLERERLLYGATEETEAKPDEDEEVLLDEYIFLATDMSPSRIVNLLVQDPLTVPLNAVPGHVYRYRMKIQIFNQYAARVERLKNPQDATKVLLESDWSEPSDPIELPPLQYMFLTSAKEEEDRELGRFEMYRWYWGEWVKDQFSARLGEQIGGERMVRHSYTGKDRTKVVFGIGTILLDIAMDRLYIPIEHEEDGSTLVRDPVRSEAAVCMTPEGDTLERIKEADKRDSIRRGLDEEMEQHGKRSRSVRSSVVVPMGSVEEPKEQTGRERGGGG